jgi:hypothetical protein
MDKKRTVGKGQESEEGPGVNGVSEKEVSMP